MTWSIEWDWDEPSEITLTDNSGAAVTVDGGRVRLAVTNTEGIEAGITLTYATAKAIADALEQAGTDSFRAEHAAMAEG
ncbi:hypothetical protein [Nocardia brasiliensis]|uniref:hypothetical protein n=1 Tax=Nocardia brasiliensis TaxID=37326 RepID=UPI002457748F|nr:hypothetical protein [Nocardia brasiliensis]